LRDVDEDSWPETVFVVRGCVFVEGELVGGAGVVEF
jgi:hypothetical protein